MVIANDKLFRLILKTDLNKHKVDWYRQKLGIEGDADTDKKTSSSEARMISRGPFIATFKHESLTFVNSLETAARPFISRKRKKRKKKSSQCNIAGELTSLKMSVKTEPQRKLNSLDPEDSRKNNGIDKELESNSPKRKKVEDKTGMIIVAEIDHDEISAVSVSPTSEDAPNNAQLNPATVLQRVDGSLNLNVNQRKKTSRRDRNRSSRKSSKSKRKKRLRSIKSVGDNVSCAGSEHSCESSCSRSLFSNETRSTGTSMSNSHEHSKGEHQRSPSNEGEDVDIREILQENSKMNGHSFSFMPPHSDVQDPYYYHGPGMPMGAPPAQMMYPYPPSSHYNAMQWQHGYPYSYHHPYYHSNADNIEYEECFLIKGVTSLFKKLFGLNDKQEIFEPSPPRLMNASRSNAHYPNYPSSNMVVSYPPALECERPAPMPRRSRSISRVFNDDDEHLQILDTESFDESDATSFITESTRTLSTAGRTLFEEKDTNSMHRSRPRLQSCEGRVEQAIEGWKAAGPTTKVVEEKVNQAMNEWKAAGPSANGTGLSITHDFGLESTEKSVKVNSHHRKNSHECKSSDNSIPVQSTRQRKLKEKLTSTSVDSKEAASSRRKHKKVLKDRSQMKNSGLIRSVSSSSGSSSSRSKKLSKQRPKSISSLSRSRTEGIGSLPKKRVERPSLIKSSSLGSASSVNQNRAGGHFHYR